MISFSPFSPRRSSSLPVILHFSAHRFPFLPTTLRFSPPFSSQNRLTYLKLFRKICENTNYKDEPHKLKEILKCLKLILTDEQSSSEEKRLAEIIIELFV